MAERPATSKMARWAEAGFFDRNNQKRTWRYSPISPPENPITINEIAEKLTLLPHTEQPSDLKSFPTSRYWQLIKQVEIISPNTPVEQSPKKRYGMRRITLDVSVSAMNTWAVFELHKISQMPYTENPPLTMCIVIAIDGAYLLKTLFDLGNKTNLRRREE